MAGNFFAKAIGLAAIGIAGYDAISTTQRQSTKYVQKMQLKRLDDVYMRTDSLEGNSAVGAGLQKWVRRWHLNDNWLFRLKDRFVSYIAGGVENLGNHLTTMGLGAVALFTGGGKGLLGKIPVLNKLAAGILAIKAGKFVLCDLFGVGASDPRRTRF